LIVKLHSWRIDDRQSGLLAIKRLKNLSGSFNDTRTCPFRAAPLFKQLSNIPHILIKNIAREPRRVLGANPVGLEGIFKMSATKETDGSSTCPCRECCNLKGKNIRYRLINRTTYDKTNVPDRSSSQADDGSLELQTDLWDAHQASSALLQQ
jgi:hypothetical protein